MNAETELRRMFITEPVVSAIGAAQTAGPRDTGAGRQNSTPADPKKPLGPTVDKKTLATKSTSRSLGWLSAAWGRQDVTT